MTETIIVALITMASGIFGAGVGAFVTIILDSRNLKWRVREEKRICYSQLISAYESLFSEASTNPVALSELPPEKERDKFTQFTSAHTNALLICDKSSIKAMADFYNAALAFCSSKIVSADLHSAYMSALSAMRKELGSSKK